MITFIISILLLIAGYFIYSKILEKMVGVDSKAVTPAYSMQDGVDYIPMKTWKVFMIQFLNIAGLGPIFGAIMGAKFGTASFLWIVFGSIFAGGVHDYLSGMISVRKNGASLPEIYGDYLGERVKKFMRFFTVILLILVGVVFIYGPAGLLTGLVPSISQLWWIIIIIIYYVLATMLPIDKIIGRIYPLFGFCLLFMALGLMIAIFIYQPHLPELWDGLGNKQSNDTNPLFPMMFITIACGAISGFHGTQSPMMARCLENEKMGRPVFYGAMIAEGIVALVWAAVATYFFFDPSSGSSLVDMKAGPAAVVDYMTKHWLGIFGAILALIGVIIAPITSGDTAFRSARLIVADFLKYNQKSIVKRLHISLPIFFVGFLVLFYAIKDSQGFDVIWRYFAWSNQVVGTVTLWAVTVYLVLKKKYYFLSLVPSIFMTMVCSTFIFIAKKEGLGLPHLISYLLGGTITIVITVIFFIWKSKNNRIINND